MGIFFSGTELIDIAVGIERRGQIFYGALAEVTEDHSAREMYNTLAQMEEGHVAVFENLRGSLSDYAPAQDYDEDYDLYLRSLVESSVFSDDEAARDMARKAEGQAEALRIAVQAEKDSIIFYIEMRSLVAAPDRQILDRVIAEEKAHLRDLSQKRMALLVR